VVCITIHGVLILAEHHPYVSFFVQVCIPGYTLYTFNRNATLNFDLYVCAGVTLRRKGVYTICVRYTHPQNAVTYILRAYCVFYWRTRSVYQCSTVRYGMHMCTLHVDVTFVCNHLYAALLRKGEKLTYTTFCTSYSLLLPCVYIHS
jgi:hypothetical protein